MHRSAFLFLSASCLKYAFAQIPPVVNTALGAINGFQCPKGNVNSFLSIPFAQPPIGDLRFAPPAPYVGSFPGGVLNATTAAPSCIQFGAPSLLPVPQQEDCLYIDIWAPANASTTSKLPVKVWIYGGAYDFGGISDPLYNGCNLATDAVVVSIAYRVGALGFLYLPSTGIAGNFGVQDILLGLQWVQDNIVAFGGDPQAVLLFGQSAGAGLTWAISTLPQAPSLISAAIGESGAGRNLVTPAAYQVYGLNYANLLGCNSTDINCFRTKSVAQINASSPITPATTETSPNKWQQFLDGTIIPVDPPSTGSKVPFLAGSNTQEGTLFALEQFQSRLTNLTSADYLTFLEANFQSQASLVAQAYSLSKFNSTSSPVLSAIVTVMTQAFFLCPTRRGLQATLAAGLPAWTYLDSHTPTCSWEPYIPPALLQLLGPTHTSEIPFVFRQQSNLPLPNGNCSLTPAEVQISNVLSSAWTSMATTGSLGLGTGIAGGPWPTFNASSSLGLLVGNGTSVGVVDYSVCAFWDQISAIALNASMMSNSTSTSPSGTSGATPATSTATIMPFTGGAAEVTVGGAAVVLAILGTMLA